MVFATGAFARRRHVKMLETGIRTVEHMFNQACKELRLKAEDLIRKAYIWHARGRCKSRRLLKNAVEQFKKLHTFPPFVVDFLNAHYRTKPA